jgi:hypothetical protein
VGVSFIKSSGKTNSNGMKETKRRREYDRQEKKREKGD